MNTFDIIVLVWLVLSTLVAMVNPIKWMIVHGKPNLPGQCDILDSLRPKCIASVFLMLFNIAVPVVLGNI